MAGVVCHWQLVAISLWLVEYIHTISFYLVSSWCGVHYGLGMSQLLGSIPASPVKLTIHCKALLSTQVDCPVWQLLTLVLQPRDVTIGSSVDLYVN